MHAALQGPGVGEGCTGIPTPWRHDLGCDGKRAHLQCLLQPQNAMVQMLAIIDHSPVRTALLSLE